jgi:protein-S-isoprenylcysteine O-methyltransferase Ste14
MRNAENRIPLPAKNMRVSKNRAISLGLLVMQIQRRNIMVSILFVLFGGPGILLLYLPLWITHFRLPAGEPVWQTLIAAVLIVAGLIPALESVRRFIYVGRGTLVPVAPPERLVVSGLYRYVRNPMYVGVMIALTGEALLFWNRGILIEAVLVCVGFDVFIRFHEEPSLASRYPEEYPSYKRNVPRWLPRLKPWNPSQG